MINIFQPSIEFDELDHLKEAFSTGWLGRGSKVQLFEEQFASFQGVSRQNIHTVSCASDSIFSILSVLKQRGLTGTIIVPTISFPAVGSAVIAAGFNLELCDVEVESAQICLESLSKAKQRYSDICAIFITHYGGSAVAVSAIREMYGNKVLVLEDSACALGSFDPRNRAVGAESDFSCWSFDAMKLLVCGEGAAVHIRDPELLNDFKEYSYLGLPSKQKSGIDSSAEMGRWWEYQLNSYGVRSVFTDINAAIGLSQIPKLEAKLERKRTIAAYYDDAISDLKNISSLSPKNVSQSSSYFYTVRSSRRDSLANFLKENDIYSTFRYFPLSMIAKFGFEGRKDFPNTEIVAETFLNIPIHDALSDAEVEKIAETLGRFDEI